jgi:opacity protein-like surface antigen
MTSQPKTKNPTRALAALLIGLGSLLPALAQIPMATEPFDRVGKTEIYGIGQYLHSDDLKFNGPNGDVKLKMDDTGLGGFGVAFHFNDFISIHADFMFGGATFSGDIPLENAANQPTGTFHVNQDTFIQTGRFNVDYNIINRRITPFLTAGIGYQYIETELEHVPPVGYCYWDPWWGWVCYSGQPHAWQTDFTWNVGGGFRWNITDTLFIKATVGATWLEYSGTHGVTTQLEGIFAIGATF